MYEDESKEFMLTLRPYQTEILLRALKQNTIVFLPTGLGKLYIATALIKLLSPDTEKKLTDGGKKSFVLVETLFLLERCTARIKKQSGLLVGTIKHDGISKYDWQSDEFDKCQVVITTPKMFKEMLIKNIISMKNINLIVIHECHQALGNEAIQQALDFYEDSATIEGPRILGLTASLLSAEVGAHRIGSVVRKLEKVLRSTVATVENIKDMDKFIACPTVKFVSYDEPVDCDILVKIQNYVKNIVELLERKEDIDVKSNIFPFIEENNLACDLPLSKSLTKHLINLCCIIEELGIYGGHIAACRLTMYFQRLGATSDKEDFKMVYLTFVRLTVMFKELMACKMVSTDAKMRICKYSNSQILALLSILKEYKHDNDRCVIFVKKRSTAEILTLIIKAATQYIRGFSFRGVDLFMGIGIDPFSNKQRCYEDNMDTIQRFQNNEIDILITTDSFNDGISEPVCKLVLRYDVPATYRAYVLSKGWASLQDSHYITLVPASRKEHDWQKMSEFQFKEDNLKRHLIGCLSINRNPEFFDLRIHQNFE